MNLKKCCNNISGVISFYFSYIIYTKSQFPFYVRISISNRKRGNVILLQIGYLLALPSSLYFIQHGWIRIWDNFRHCKFWQFIFLMVSLSLLLSLRYQEKLHPCQGHSLKYWGLYHFCFKDWKIWGCFNPIAHKIYWLKCRHTSCVELP